MEFAFETIYGPKAVTTMARALRKTVRKKRSHCSHILGWIIIVIAVLLTLPLGDRDFVMSPNTIVTWIAVLVMLIVLLFEDRINGYVARKRALAGTGRATTIFSDRDENYRSTTDIGTTEFHYDSIQLLAETNDYFVFIFDKNHAQVYDKHALSGGTIEEFRNFITEKTGKMVVHI